MSDIQQTGKPCSKNYFTQISRPMLSEYSEHQSSFLEEWEFLYKTKSWKSNALIFKEKQ